MTNTDLLIVIKGHLDKAIKHAASLDHDVEFAIIDRLHAEEETLTNFITNLTDELRAEVTARIEELS